MGMKPIVSIISPCYNGEKYVGRMLESILKQTYKNIELICVDDGSKDNTAKIINSYSLKFDKEAMKLKYVYQENKGQASAVNNGLKQVNGDYLCWIDCDDFLTEDSVKAKLDVLERNPNYGICTSDLYLVNETDINKILSLNSRVFGHLNFQSNQFMLTVVGLSSIECHAHMIRMKDFDYINPNREIDCCRAGQNFQMLLPMYYHFSRIYVEKPLGYYVIRQNSHYHRKRDKEQEIKRLKNLNRMLRAILEKLNITQSEIDKLMRMSQFSAELKRI
jgi:glycosyltransferase involved in cell wall biosynthesis